ncbi:MAG: hypothetical protein ABIU63_04710 [Chitinophagaceae bacterium]
MEKKPPSPKNDESVKKGYNEHNPGQPQGTFPPASDNHPPAEDTKSNAADKKAKEEKEEEK